MRIHCCRHVYHSRHEDGHGHQCCHGEGRHGHGEGCHGRGEGRGQGGGRHRGRGLRRLFDHGDLHIMVLSLVAKNLAMAMKLSKISKKPQMAFMYQAQVLFIQR